MDDYGLDYIKRDFQYSILENGVLVRLKTVGVKLELIGQRPQLDR